MNIQTKWNQIWFRKLLYFSILHSKIEIRIIKGLLSKCLLVFLTDRICFLSKPNLSRKPFLKTVLVRVDRKGFHCLVPHRGFCGGGLYLALFRTHSIPFTVNLQGCLETRRTWKSATRRLGRTSSLLRSPRPFCSWCGRRCKMSPSLS